MSQATPRSLLGQLAGADCQFCDDGTLHRDTYKENRALVCDCCETPGVQVW